MSTVDPRILRAQNEERARRSGLPVMIAVIVGLLHLGLWTLAGYGFGTLYDVARLMSMNQVGDGWESRHDGVPVLFLIGLFGGSFGGFAFTASLSRLRLGPAAFLAPLVTGCFGIALGLALFASQWTPPQAVGEKLGFVEGDAPEPWGFDAWVNYTLPTWLPALVAGLGVLLLIVTVLAASARRRKEKRMAEVIETGRRALGTVSEVRATGTEINDMPYLEFSVAFRDHLGGERWVTKKSVFPPGSVPRPGDPAVVWFVPETVGDQKTIVVGLGPEASEMARGERGVDGNAP
jgi:TctA family transporter